MYCFIISNSFPCPLYHECPDGRLSTMSVCEPEFYSDEYGASECKPCPDKYTCLDGKINDLCPTGKPRFENNMVKKFSKKRQSTRSFSLTLTLGGERLGACSRPISFFEFKLTDLFELKWLYPPNRVNYTDYP